MPSTRFASPAALAAFTLAAACGPKNVSALQQASAVSIAPATCALAAGQEQQLSAKATLLDAGTMLSPSSGLGWGTDDPGVATVSDTGLVKGIAAGTATITATYEGATGTVDCVVSP